MLGNVVYDNVLTGQQPAVRGGRRDHPGGDDGGLPARRYAGPARWTTSERTRLTMTLARDPGRAAALHRPRCWLVIYVPLALVVLNSFNTRATFALAAAGLHLSSGGGGAGTARARATRCGQRRGGARGHRDRARARHDGGVRAAAVPLLRPRRRLAADHPAHRAARHRHRHRAEQRVPAPSSGSSWACSTIVVAHATFCIVMVFNNVIARLRRLGGNLEEASMDLGAGTFTTFRLVTLPDAALGPAGRRRCCPSRCRFDEIIVTTFTAGHGRPDAAALDLPATCSGPTRRRSSTSSRRRSSCCRSCRSGCRRSSPGPTSRSPPPARPRGPRW